MNLYKQNILISFLVLYSVYCSITIGETWDEQAHLDQGEIVLKYLFSLGRIDDIFLYRENYSAIYWSLAYLTTKIFPSQYEIEISHLINLFFSLCTLVGIGKLCRELFNKAVGKIVFLILFFYPVFFGHMGINSKDSILAFSHIWITFFILKYIRKQDIKEKANKYIFYIASLCALATGIQLVFIGSLIPIVFFALYEIYIGKKFIIKDFSKKIFFIDLFKCFLMFYFILVFFWIDVHSNLFSQPIKILMGTLSETYWTGWPYNLVNGEYSLTINTTKLYFLINLIYKSPEYMLVCYLIFFFFLIVCNNFYKKKIYFFNYKIFFIFILLLFPNVLIFFIPYPLYDGMRLFLWAVPYYSIIPGLVIYYFINNYSQVLQKTFIFMLSFLCVFHLFNFFLITPYHYTYLNYLNGDIKYRYQKFENDYWGASIKELIKNTKLEKDTFISITTCGINTYIVKKHLKKSGYANFKFVSQNDADYVIMTNRAEADDKIDATNVNESISCFDKFTGTNISEVKRNGAILSVVRKI